MTDIVLPSTYYVDNFVLVINTVLRRYHDLLTNEEHQFIKEILSLPENARRILVRMLGRRGPWFRRQSLSYAEIEQVQLALNELLDKGLAADRSSAELADLTELLRKDEIIELLRKFNIPHKSTSLRDDLEASLLELAENEELFSAVANITDPIAPLGAEHLQLFLLLFFGNFEQDLTDFVLRDIGRARYETYRIDESDRLFTNRADVDFLLHTATLDEEATSATEEGDIATLADCAERAIAMSPRQSVRLQRRYSRLLNSLGRDLERTEQLELALRCYACSQLPPARERTARILAKTERLNQACTLAKEIADAPLDASEERFASQFLRRQKRHSDVAAAWALANPPSPTIPAEHFHLQRTALRVEELTLLHAKTFGFAGAFVENALWCGIFGLLFWDEIFAPVPGAFQHEFQAAPFDISSPDFFTTRADAINAKLTQLKTSTNEQFGALLREVYQSKFGLMNRFLDWESLTSDVLSQFCRSVPPNAVAEIMGIMVRNPLRFDSGFPDLFLWNPDTCECVFWEVKGPGDSLRPEQEFWLRELNGRGLRAAVVHVKYPAHAD